MDKKIYFENDKALILIDLEEIFPMKLSEFEISHLVESYEKETAEN